VPPRIKYCYCHSQTLRFILNNHNVDAYMENVITRLTFVATTFFRWLVPLVYPLRLSRLSVLYLNTQ
jgi:hypothetical protein